MATQSFQFKFCKLKCDWVTLFIFVCLIWGCASKENYEAVLNSGKGTITAAKQFRQVFPQSWEFISYYDGKSGKPTWNSKALLYNRYILTMQMHIAISFYRNEVTGSESPRMFLSEVNAIEDPAGGQPSATYAHNIELSKEQAKILLESGGDFEKLGINLKTNMPITGISKFWKAL